MNLGKEKMMVLVFDFGATRTRLALASDGKLEEIVRMDTDASHQGLAKLLGSMRQLAEGHKIRAVVGGLPGQVQGTEGKLTLAPNLVAWLGMPIRARMEEMFDCPVYIANDVVMGGLGESHDGAGSAKGVMAYFTVSTGVNAVRIVDGWVDTTISRYEIGKQLIGKTGHKLESLEFLTGGAAFSERHGKAPREVRDAAVWQVQSRVLARGVYNTMLHWAPEVIVFGGSMMRDIELEVVAHELAQLPAVFPELPRLAYAKLGDTAGLHGALVWLEQIKK
jgi:fructokinase